jgi:hypothetical protein
MHGAFGGFRVVAFIQIPYICVCQNQNPMKRLVTLCVLLCTVVFAFGQDIEANHKKVTDFLSKPSLRLQPLRILTDELQLTYAFPIVESKSTQLYAGVVYPNPYLAAWSTLFSPLNLRFESFGIYAGIGRKIYGKSNPKNYFNYSIVYKFKFLRNVEYWTGGISGNTMENLTLNMNRNQHILQPKILIGKDFIYGNTVLDFFMGIGGVVMLANSSYKILENNWHTSVQDWMLYFSDGFYAYPTFHTGFNIGWGLK